LGRVYLGCSCPSGNLQSRRRILSITLSGRLRKGFGISLTLSFGNPQPGGFNPLYHSHDPFGLFEERIRADFNRDIHNLILRKPPIRRFQPLYPFHDPFVLFEERIRADSFLDILSLILRKPPTGRFQPFVSFP
jgi:hypothetical protein